MRTKYLIVMFFIMGVANAQKTTGIKFEHGLSWQQIQEKAKKENKYIFIDAYTTWCGPCKMMDQNIFPQKKVGEFFNAFFINVKVQIDSTQKDDDQTKKWYKDAQDLVNTYNIDSYPTYLFFNPKGEIVHRINGGSTTADEFISKSEAALAGYPKQKWQFIRGSKDFESLLGMMKSARLMNDREFIPVVTNTYLTTQNDLLTEENLKLIASNTRHITDPGFSVLRNQADKADQVLGKGKSARLVKIVVFDDIVFPYLRKNGVKKDYGGMFGYLGEVNESVNWTEVEGKLKKEFPDLSDEILLTSKPTYYKWAANWPAFASYISSQKNVIAKDQLDSYANDVFLFCDDPASIEKAVGWSEYLLTSENEHNIGFLSTYANLLYKTGKKGEGVKTMEQVVALSGEKEGDLIKRLEKMKSGEKTW
ncbi:thioredoxin family protein [Salmonirosea aquatica]|uniref:Thioredoxin fold domain-containing protein n=1 Tax=Salmonirosea aquatica TaxID=2654236 RepID=A0A7C9BLY0_9BACT|nr:thioredoxin fold domain-containing protein [Cytophagaceae bacterium SJW1-29]